MKFKLLTTLLFLFSTFVSSDSLLDIYNDALENDPQYRSAEFSYLSGKEIKVQGRANLLPSITLNAQTNWNEYYQNGNLQNQYNNFSTSARLTQPLIRLDTWFKYRQSKFLTDAAEADFAYSQQSLIVRTAELYFNVLRAIDNLSAARSEEKAIKKECRKFNKSLSNKIKWVWEHFGRRSPSLFYIFYYCSWSAQNG